MLPFSLNMNKSVWSVITIIMIVISSLSIASGTASAQKTINGAGATFPYPVYSQWAYRYNQLTGVQLNYQSIGSGGGIAQIQAKTVDFGASDAPLTVEELDQDGLVQFPTVFGGVVPVINLEGIEAGEIKLSNELLADIFLGTITKWNDPRIKALNSAVALPNRDITTVHRADGSGTTWIYTNYLSKVSREWNDTVGSGKSVSWPGGVGGKGNEGVAAYVQRINGSIGYVEFAYALQNGLTFVAMQNQAGNFVEPTIETFQAAAANADWENAPGFYMVLTDQPGAESWPITGATFILMHASQTNAATAKAVLDFFNWGYAHGDEIATDLHYVPIPDNVIAMVKSLWSGNIKAGGSPVWSE